MGKQQAKETVPQHLESFIKAMDVLKSSVNAPTTVGLRDPSSVQADLATAQQQQKPKKHKSTASSYATAVTGQSVSTPLPIGAKRPSVKATAKAPSGAIGAPIVAKAKAKTLAGKIPAGTTATAKPDTTGQQDADITPDSALDYLKNAPADQTFADFYNTVRLQVIRVQHRILNQLHPHRNQRHRRKMQGR